MLAYSKAIAAGVGGFLAPITAYLLLDNAWSWRWFAAAILTGLGNFTATWGTKTDPSALEAPRVPERRHLARKD